MGYYTLYLVKIKDKTVYRVDNGKTILIRRFNKRIVNPYRDIKDFPTLKGAVDYVVIKLNQHKKFKEKRLNKVPKSLYLVLIREEKTGKVFIKVGFTSKKFIKKRFSKTYGYDGYVVETILRRVDTPDAEKIELEIKNEIKRKKTIKKYRPILENFSGYSECFDFNYLKEIIEIFDNHTKIDP